MSPDLCITQNVSVFKSIFSSSCALTACARPPSVPPLVCACPTVAICCGRDAEPEEEVRVWLALGVRGMGVPGEEVILPHCALPCPQSRQASERMVTGREV